MYSKNKCLKAMVPCVMRIHGIVAVEESRSPVFANLSFGCPMVIRMSVPEKTFDGAIE